MKYEWIKTTMKCSKCGKLMDINCKDLERDIAYYHCKNCGNGFIRNKNESENKFIKV